MISLTNHDSSEGEQWGRDQIYPDSYRGLINKGSSHHHQPIQGISSKHHFFGVQRRRPGMNKNRQRSEAKNEVPALVSKVCQTYHQDEKPWSIFGSPQN